MMNLKNPHHLHKFGTILLWTGVLVWAPYIALRIAGGNPSLWLFLPFHLAGVIGGSRLRLAANQQLGKPKEKRTGFKRVAHLVVIASILVWIPYYALKLTGRPVELAPWLVIHLMGMFSGIGLMGIGSAVQYFRRNRQAKEDRWISKGQDLPAP
jgi:hypothetical protein